MGNWKTDERKKKNSKNSPVPGHEKQWWGPKWSSTTGIISSAVGVKDEDDKKEEDFYHAFSLELQIFHQGLPKIPTGCSC